MTTRRDLELELAAERARREALEQVNERLLVTLERVAPAVAAPRASVVAPLADAPPLAEDPAAKVLTTRVWDECEALAYGDTRQAAINRRVARKFAQQGMSEAEVVQALRRGEEVVR